jgi:hypothetical protein
MTLSRILLFGMLLGATPFLGCRSMPSSEPRVIDVTNKPQWWGKLHRHAILILTQDAFLNKEAILLDTYDTSTVGPTPTVTVVMFKASPDKYWKDLHLLAKGTRLECVRLERWFGPQGGEDYLIWVNILDGDWKGKTAYLTATGGNPHVKGSLELGRNSEFVRLMPDSTN